MNILIFGATGMVGQGVLRECLHDPGVQLVQVIGRTLTGVQHPKLREIVRQGFVALRGHRNRSVRLRCMLLLPWDNGVRNDGRSLRARHL